MTTKDPAAPALARLRSALRPTFRLTKRDVRVLLVVLAAAGVVACVLGWYGEWFVMAMLCWYCIVGCAPAAIVILLAMWRNEARWGQRAARVALVAMLLVVASVPMAFLAAQVEEWSVDVSRRRGLRIADALERFKVATGEYPASLEQLASTEDVRVGAPATDPEGWHYWTDGREYSLQFGSGFMEVHALESGARSWHHD